MGENCARSRFPPFKMSAILRRDFSFFVSAFQKEELESLRASGTKEDANEITDLLTQIVEEMREVEEKSIEKRQQIEDEKKAGRNSRNSRK